jgi:LAGLIDADG endonuclease
MFNISKNPSKLGFSVRPVFQIAVHESDRFILDKIKKYFNDVGSITKVKLYYYYKVESFKDMRSVIIPPFEKYPLLSINKSKSFFLLKSCVELISINRKDLTEDQLLKILKYKASFKQGLNAKVFETYKDIEPISDKEIPKPVYKKINPYWISGFTAGDGSFGAYWHHGGYRPSFRISQDKVDELLLMDISEFFGCGGITRSSTGMRDFYIRNIYQLNRIIIPFFNKYKLCTSKEIDFNNFCEILEIINKKGNNDTTKEKIKLLTLKMNNYRRKIS